MTQISDFLIAFLMAFGISGVIAIILIIIKKITEDEADIKTKNDEEFDVGIKSSILNGFDDMIIEFTRERLNQEIQISSAVETKAGVLIGSVGVILTIIFSTGLNFYYKIFQQQIFTSIPFIIGLLIFITVFVICAKILIPSYNFI